MLKRIDLQLGFRTDPKKMLLEIIFGKKRANKMPGLYIGKEYERKAIQKGDTRPLPLQP